MAQVNNPRCCPKIELHGRIKATDGASVCIITGWGANPVAPCRLGSAKASPRRTCLCADATKLVRGKRTGRGAASEGCCTNTEAEVYFALFSASGAAGVAFGTLAPACWIAGHSLASRGPHDTPSLRPQMQAPRQGELHKWDDRGGGLRISCSGWRL